MSQPDYDARMREHLLRELAPYDIGAERLTITYEDYMQDYDVLISGGPLTDEQIAGLITTMSKGGCFRFTDEENERRWSDALRRRGREFMKARAAEARLANPELPTFDRSADTLAGFARSLEIWAGVELGSTLKVVNEHTITVEPSGSAMDIERARKLVVMQDLLAAEDIDIMVVVMASGEG